MATLYITEYRRVAGIGNAPIPMVNLEHLRTTALTFTGTSAATASAVGSDTEVVRLLADANCSVAFAVGSAPTATTAAGVPLPANAPEYFAVGPLKPRIAAITRATT